MNSNAFLERHPNLYFPDGDIVLAVKEGTIHGSATGDLEKYILFRVHKFLLRHHSATFSNFFADANAAPTEVYDGVPLAEMHGDRAKDFAMLLGYLYDPSSLVFRRHDPDTPLAVSGVIRLADKYLIEPLHRCLVQQVCEDWPTMLNEFDVQQAEIDALRNLETPAYGLTPDGKPRRLADVVPEPASAILFAQEFGCLQILPAAFYRLSLTPVDTHGRKDAPQSLTARWPLLGKENLLRYIHGCQFLHEYRPNAPEFMCGDCEGIWALEEDEDFVHPCHEFIERLFHVVWAPRPSPTHPDPLRLLAKCVDYEKIPQLSKKHYPQGLCKNCRIVLVEELHEERKKIWEQLSTAFQLT
ncbi:hypothetical protein GSI_08685 [Ganoderma sinense ZZ0214-1]|uniref:BTB domain-containing protein n=1 Tax=Ganoderma sinense ZZ0214-1 TaxID=1077348 RepID=A0A2G8S4D8_9APHY|nr:hypothetical protein GSI_08685 [Ganoderma sinense ZZ0214-1]